MSLVFLKDDKLNKAGLHLIVWLAKRLPERWGEEAFLVLSALGVQENIELIIIENGMSLWAWRKDGFFRGWHVPGTKRRQKETYQEGATRCAINELGCDVRVVRAIAHVDHPDSPRFHEAVVLVLCELAGQPTKRFASEKLEELKPGELRWFNHCPEDIVSFQLRYWPHAEPYMKGGLEKLLHSAGLVRDGQLTELGEQALAVLANRQESGKILSRAF